MSEPLANSVSQSQPLKTWETSCFKYSVISLIAIAAIVAVVLGGIATSGKLAAIGKVGGIGMTVAGGSVVVALLALYVGHRQRILSHEQSRELVSELKQKEYFLFTDEQGRQAFKVFTEQNRILTLHVPHDEFFSWYPGYTEVSLKELQNRLEISSKR